MSGTADNNGNSKRVANYVLAAKLDALTEKIDGFCQRADDLHNDHEERLRTVEHDITTIKERQGIFVAGQSTLTLIASVIAGWFGSRQ